MTGKPILDTILKYFNITGCLLGISIFVYTELIYTRPLPNAFDEYKKMQEEARNLSKSPSYKLDKITINLVSKHTKLRYLDIEMQIVPLRTKDVSLLEKIAPLIYDQIIDISGKMLPEEINTVTGKLLYEDRLKKSINNIVGRPTVKEIYFTRFVVQ